jgi:glycosyltransferase involved in cell wall biosynthesis
MTKNNIIVSIAKILSRSKTKLILNERNYFSLGYQYLKPRRLCRLKQLVHWLYPKAHKIIVGSFGVADDLSEATNIPREMIHVVRNPVDIEMIQKQAQEPINHPWLHDPNLFVFLNVARLTKQKGQDNMIRAFSLVQNPRARLLIIGTGQRKRILEDVINEYRLKDRVQLLGFANNPHAYMATADAFILTSEWEGLPQVLTEAMACGAPVILSDCPAGPREIMAPETDYQVHLTNQIELTCYGILTPAPTTRNAQIGTAEQQIALAMEYIITNEEARKRWSQNSKKRAMNFVTEKWIQEWLNIIET